MRPEKYNKADHDVSPIMPGQEESLATRRSELRDREGSNAQQAMRTINADETRRNGSNADNGANQLRPGDPKQFTTRLKKKPEIAAEDRSSWGQHDKPTQKSGDSVHSTPVIKAHDWRSRGYANGPLSTPYKHADLSHTPTAKKRKLPTAQTRSDQCSNCSAASGVCSTATTIPSCWNYRDRR
jgi:hypothetical protein